MAVIRSASWLVSTLVHGSLAAFFIVPWAGGNALESGDGNDDIVIDQGISIQGVGFGTGMVTTEAVEETPMEMSAARPEIQEVIAPEPEEPKPEDPLEALPEDTVVLQSQSETAPELEAEAEREEEVAEQEKPQEAQVATLEQQARIAVQEEIQSGAALRGGDATASAKRAYKSALWRHIFKRSVGGRNGLEGRVVVEITIDVGGKLIDTNIVKSSGYKRLDDLAIRNIERAAPFKTLPDAMSYEPFVVKVPFNFRVARNSKRR